ncbi:GAF domain-containing protein [Sorangium sp. So ce1151]|uniref:GAF domain-containing protein n=1 Tax=Sorangium sp. So ce1151 TaxID=3133332 RepID=UPI003F61D8E4
MRSPILEFINARPREAPLPTPEQLLNDVVWLVGEALHADRCFLWVRRPSTRLSRGAFVWRRDESVPDLTAEQRAWVDESIFPAEDPLYAAALACHPSVYVDDVRTAARSMVNRDFEDRNFGHRALIHAHIVADGELWGILQPCVFGRPRGWTDADRELIEPLLPRLAPVVKAFVEG